MDSTVNQAAGSAPLGNTGTLENEYSSNGDGNAGTTGRVDSAKEAITSRVQAGTDWLKDQDIDQMKQKLETQVREHPVRTLLVALGAGYLLGKALRR